MNKLLTILLVCFSLVANAQTPVQKVGNANNKLEVLGQTQLDSVVFLPQYSDTLFTPGRAAALIYRKIDKNLYYYNGLFWTKLTGVAWGTIPGILYNQTDIRDSLLARQMLLVNGYGTKIINNTVNLDSSAIRKLDTMYRRIGVDSIYFSVFGKVYAILDSAGGGGGGGTITGTGNLSPLFNTSIVTNSIVYAPINQSPNLFYAGPSIGVSAAPTFRALSVGDLPTGIPSSNLSNSNINFATGTSGTDINWSVASINLGGSAVLNIPTANTTNRGLLSSGDWNTFNNKVTSVNGRLGVVVTKIADTLKSLPVDTTSNRQGYVLSFDSTNHKWYLGPGGGGGGTSYTIGAIDGNGSAANGLSISGSSIFAQSASASAPGLMNTGTQVIAGNKTWAGSVTMTGVTQKTPGATDSAVLSRLKMMIDDRNTRPIRADVGSERSDAIGVVDIKHDDLLGLPKQ